MCVADRDGAATISMRQKVRSAERWPNGFVIAGQSLSPGRYLIFQPEEPERPFMKNTERNKIWIVAAIAALASVAISGPLMASGQKPLPVENVFSPKTSSINKSDDGEKQIRRVQLGETTTAFAVGNVLLAGQLQSGDFQKLQQFGIKRVVNLGSSSNASFDEIAWCKSMEIEYQQVPFDRADQLNDNVFNAVRIALLESDETPVLIHGGSMEHVAAVWVVYRALDQGIDLKTALQEASSMGMKTGAFDQPIRGYVARMMSIPSQYAPAASSPTMPTTYTPYVQPAPGSS